MEITEAPEGYVLIIKDAFIANAKDMELKALFHLFWATEYLELKNDVDIIHSLFKYLLKESMENKRFSQEIVEGLIKIILGKLLFIFSHIAWSQTPLERMLEQTEANYPTLKANKLYTEAAAYVVKAERNDFFPKATIAYQGNYATANNITGMSFPGQLPPISGPPSGENTYDLASGSAAALLMTWSPYTFGKQSSTIRRSTAEANEIAQQEELSVFAHKVRFIETYLNYQEILKLEEAQLAVTERLEFNLDLTRQLARNGISPGVDTATVHAEYARS